MGKRSPEKILIVDDEQQNRDVLRRLMTRLGYEAITASNGDAALRSVRADRPDLVLLDVNMPGIDGFEVCRPTDIVNDSRHTLWRSGRT